MSHDIDFQPTTPPRPNSLYISWQLHKALGYVAKKTGGTREDVAEVVLRSFLIGQHSDVLEFLEKRELEEKAFVKTLEKPKQ